MVEQITRIEELEYKWVDGYKHRGVLVDIGWGYSVRDGYTTTDPQVITLTNTLERILKYKENGITNLTEYLIEFIMNRPVGIGLFTRSEEMEQFNKLLVGVNRLVEDIELVNLGDLYIAEGMVTAIESGNLEDVIDHVEYQMIINGDFMKSMYTKRFYYEGRGYNVLDDIEPGTERYRLEGFVQDSRGYLYTEDIEYIDKLDEDKEAYDYLMEYKPGLRKDIIKKIKVSKYAPLTLPEYETELEDMVDEVASLIMWLEKPVYGTVTIADEYRNVTHVGGFEEWLDEHYGGIEY